MATATIDDAPSLPAHFTVNDLQRIFHVTHETIYVWTRLGKLPKPIRLNNSRKLLYPRDQILKLLRGGNSHA
jgi:hypothetical protein